MKKYLLILLLSGFGFTQKISSANNQEGQRPIANLSEEAIQNLIEERFNVLERTLGENSIFIRIYRTRNVREASVNLMRYSLLNQETFINIGNRLRGLEIEQIDRRIIQEIIENEGYAETALQYNELLFCMIEAINDKLIELNQAEQNAFLNESRQVAELQINLLTISGEENAAHILRQIVDGDNIN